MADVIDPSNYDAVVISSGLPEVLIASALSRAGQAVLVLDPADSYGTSWSSLSGAEFVHQLINTSVKAHQQQQQQRPASAPAAGSGRDVAVRQQHQLAGVHGCSMYTHPRLEQALSDKGLIIDLAPRVLYQDEPLVQLLVSCQAHNYLEFKLVEGNYVYLDGRLQPVPASRADLFADRTLSLADKRSLGRFMAACVEAAEGAGRLKDVFDNRPLIELLVAEGLNERLQQVVLYGIAMADQPQHTQAQQQQPQRVSAQTESQQEQQQQPSAAMTTSPAAATGSPAASPTPGTQQQQQQQPGGNVVTAADGLVAFVLYSQSLGKYGGGGALMAPSYGSGSLPEAFVRLAAVKGAVTALRHRTQRIQLNTEAEAAATAEAEAEAEAETAATAEATATATATAEAEAGAEPLLAAAQVNASGAVSGAAAAEPRGEVQQQPAAGSQGPSGQQGSAGGHKQPAASGVPVATAPPRLRLTLANGQQLTAGAVVSDGSAVSGASSSSSSSAGGGGGGKGSTVYVARAVAVLDGSLVQGDTSLLFVIPPGSLGPWQSCVIRGLQLGHALSVAPPGHCLLYLTAVMNHQQQQQQQQQQTSRGSTAADAGPPLHGDTAAAATVATSLSASGPGAASSSSSSSGSSSGSCFSTSTAAEQLLGRAIAAVANAQGLQAFRDLQPNTTPQLQEQQQPGMGGVVQAQEQQQSGTAGAVQAQPQVLAACFYSVEGDEQQPAHQLQGLCSLLDGHLLLCPQAPAAGFAGYTRSIEAAESLFRQHFPHLPWLTDPVQQQAAPAAAGADVAAAAEASEDVQGGPAAGGDAGGFMFDDEQDAIDELTAALMELSSGLESVPGQGSSTTHQL